MPKTPPFITLASMVDKTNNEGSRFWVNDGVGAEVKIDYGHPDANHTLETEFKAVGLVDEEDGGTIAYGKPEIMERLADDLNRLHIIEELMHS